MVMAEERRRRWAVTTRPPPRSIFTARRINSKNRSAAKYFIIARPRLSWLLNTERNDKIVRAEVAPKKAALLVEPGKRRGRVEVWRRGDRGAGSKREVSGTGCGEWKDGLAWGRESCVSNEKLLEISCFKAVSIPLLFDRKCCGYL